MLADIHVHRGMLVYVECTATLCCVCACACREHLIDAYGDDALKQQGPYKTPSHNDVCVSEARIPTPVDQVPFSCACL